ncbi:MAG TPA: dihydroorotate dehydrogenase electron transfer subunit [Thermodesulfovibrionales bacterium]|nr:dihydroorotate dehydrogenase electron transfer subunit [Thermodesulfovibrionales bacterium]
MSRYFTAEIAENRPLNNDFHLLTFFPLGHTKEPQPGQFYMLSTLGKSRAGSSFEEIHDPLLKRPFSLFRKTGKGLQILFRIRGRGTAMMKELKKSSLVNVLGPLGNSYPFPAGNKTPLIIAGGIGIASLFYFAERLSKAKKKAYISYGVRSENELFMTDEVKRFAKELFISTDDGSCGERGCVTDMVGGLLSRIPSLGTNSVIYACGPRKMLEAVSRMAKQKGIEAYLSMEEVMACGVGACLGCVVKTVSGYKRVCKEGPIFDAKEIVW